MLEPPSTPWFWGRNFAFQYSMSIPVNARGFGSYFAFQYSMSISACSGTGSRMRRVEVVDIARCHRGSFAQSS